MAEALARYLGGDTLDVYSAGIEPQGMNPLAVAAMDEIGIDIRGQKSKGINADLIKSMDWVITVCGNAEERCPVLPGSIGRLHWPLDDPAAGVGRDSDRVLAFKKVRDELHTKIVSFLKEVS